MPDMIFFQTVEFNRLRIKLRRLRIGRLLSVNRTARFYFIPNAVSELCIQIVSETNCERFINSFSRLYFAILQDLASKYWLYICRFLFTNALSKRLSHRIPCVLTRIVARATGVMIISMFGWIAAAKQNFEFTGIDPTLALLLRNGLQNIGEESLPVSGALKTLNSFCANRFTLCSFSWMKSKRIFFVEPSATFRRRSI